MTAELAVRATRSARGSSGSTTSRRALYGLQEFWDEGDGEYAQLKQGDNVMLCPSGRGGNLVKYRDLPCTKDALRPRKGISLGFNKRLHQAEAEFNGVPTLTSDESVVVSSRIMNNPYVPLVLDVNGGAAAKMGYRAVYITPPADSTGEYGTGDYWFPSDPPSGPDQCRVSRRPRPQQCQSRRRKLGLAL